MSSIKIEQKQTQAAPVKWFAANDAKNRSKINKALWSSAVHFKVDNMLNVLSLIYVERAYEDYNVKTAGVKVSGKTVKNSWLLEEAENGWAKDGVVKVVTSTGVRYRLP